MQDWAITLQLAEGSVHHPRSRGRRSSVTYPAIAGAHVGKKYKQANAYLAFLVIILHRMVLQAYAALRKDSIGGNSKLRDAELKRLCLEPPEGETKGLLGRYVFQALMSCAYNAVHEFRMTCKSEYEDKRLPWPVDAAVIEQVFDKAAILCGINPKALPSRRSQKRTATPPPEIDFDSKRQHLNNVLQKYRRINVGLEIMDTTS